MIMKNKEKNFLRNFTWKKFFLWSLYWFAATLLVAVALDYFDSKASMDSDLALINIIKRLIGSLVVGFFIALWTQPNQRASHS